MNVNLRRDFNFHAGYYIPSLGQHKLHCNYYSLTANLITNTDNFNEVNLAMDRVVAMIDWEFTNTVFVNQIHSQQIKTLKELDINITTLPEEPLDQVVGIMLYCKLNAVMEQRMSIWQLDISSHLGDKVWYQHTVDDNLGPFAEQGWWHYATPQHALINNEDNSISTIHCTSWTQYQLNWPDSENNEPRVVYADFRRDEN